MFGGSDRFNSVINFLGIENGRPMNLERISVFSVQSGREWLHLEWDPRPFVGYLAVPALSPDGKKLATIRSARLVVFATGL